MDFSVYKQLPSKKHLKAVDTDIVIPISLQSDVKDLQESEIQHIINLSQQFDKERQSCKSYRFSGKAIFTHVKNFITNYNTAYPNDNIEDIIDLFDIFIVIPHSFSSTSVGNIVDLFDVVPTSFSVTTNETSYKAHLLYTKLSNINDYIIKNFAFSQNIYKQQNYLYLFNEKYDIADLIIKLPFREDGFLIDHVCIYFEYKGNGNHYACTPTLNYNIPTISTDSIFGYMPDFDNRSQENAFALSLIDNIFPSTWQPLLKDYKIEPINNQNINNRDDLSDIYYAIKERVDFVFQTNNLQKTPRNVFLNKEYIKHFLGIKSYQNYQRELNTNNQFINGGLYYVDITQYSYTKIADRFDIIQFGDTSNNVVNSTAINSEELGTDYSGNSVCFTPLYRIETRLLNDTPTIYTKEQVGINYTDEIPSHSIFVNNEHIWKDIIPYGLLTVENDIPFLNNAHNINSILNITFEIDKSNFYSFMKYHKSSSKNTISFIQHLNS